MNALASLRRRPSYQKIKNIKTLKIYSVHVRFQIDTRSLLVVCAPAQSFTISIEKSPVTFTSIEKS